MFNTGPSPPDRLILLDTRRGRRFLALQQCAADCARHRPPAEGVDVTRESVLAIGSPASKESGGFKMFLLKTTSALHPREVTKKHLNGIARQTTNSRIDPLKARPVQSSPERYARVERRNPAEVLLTEERWIVIEILVREKWVPQPWDSSDATPALRALTEDGRDSSAQSHVPDRRPSGTTAWLRPRPAARRNRSRT